MLYYIRWSYNVVVYTVYCQCLQWNCSQRVRLAVLVTRIGFQNGPKLIGSSDFWRSLLVDNKKPIITVFSIGSICFVRLLNWVGFYGSRQARCIVYQHEGYCMLWKRTGDRSVRWRRVAGQRAHRQVNHQVQEGGRKGKIMVTLNIFNFRMMLLRKLEW